MDLLTGFQPASGTTAPHQHGPEVGIPASSGSTWTTLPIYSTVYAATNH
jgi:hypothetical protein